MENNFVEILCPFSRTSKKDGITRRCESLCVKVAPGSSGETFCRKCKLAFEFEVNVQNSLQSSMVRTKNINSEDEE